MQYSTASRRSFILCGLVALATAAFLLLSGRPSICTCGTVALWHGAIDSGNSQHLSDWYSPSHLIHGFLFYAFGWWLMRSRPVGQRLVLATIIEAAWEIAENSPFIIDRYRTATIALGYTGDSVVNSLSDIGFMILGFLLAHRLPVWISIAVCVGFELLTLAVIRDNLTLNVLMLIAPVDAIKVWQSAA
ncbi:MAG: DUF2585 domain-containing protein [Sphingomonadaceae bacterium]